jgi:phosphate:Na+ symporter
LFNLGNLLVFIWFTGPLSRLVNRIVPERPKPIGIRPLYLDEFFLEQAALALDQVRRELVRLSAMVRSMLERSLHVTTIGSESEVASLALADNDIDAIYEGTIRYLGKLSQKDLILRQPQQLSQFVAITNYLENIGDVIEKDLLAVARKRIRIGLTISPATQEKLRAIDRQVCKSFDDAIVALENGDRNSAVNAVESKELVNELATEATAHIAKRLVADEPNRLEAFELETDIIESYRRVNTYTRRIAKLCLEMQSDEPADLAGEQALTSKTLGNDATE